MKTRWDRDFAFDVGNTEGWCCASALLCDDDAANTVSVSVNLDSKNVQARKPTGCALPDTTVRRTALHATGQAG